MNEPGCLTKEEYIEHFRSSGYIIVHGVYTQNEISRAREIFTAAFKNEVWKNVSFSSREIINDIYRIYPELTEIIFNGKYVNALKAILGEQLVCIPECSAHHNRYYDWHKDSSQMESLGSKAHLTGEDFMVQCCTYFQDNAPTGGGMTVIPGTHLKRDRFLKAYSAKPHHRLYYKLLKLLQISPFYDVEKNEPNILLPSKAGDLVIIDIRLDHRASFLRKLNGLPQTSKSEKYAVFNAFGKPGTLAREYLAKLKAGKGNYNQYLRHTTFAPNLIEKAGKLGFVIYE